MMTVLLLASVVAAAPPAPSVALLPLEPLGTEAQIVEVIEGFLRGEVERLGLLQLQERAQTVTQLERIDPEAQGCTEPSCLSRLAAACEVERLLLGTVATLGDAYVLDLKLFDADSSAFTRRDSTQLRGEREVMINGIREAAVRILAPERFAGTLEILLERFGAEVFVDGTRVGTTPLPPISGLEPGAHAVRIALKSYDDFDRFVDIRYGQTTLVAARLVGTTIDAAIVSEELHTFVQAYRDRTRLNRALALGTVVLGAAVAVVGGGLFYLVGQGQAADYSTAQTAYANQRPQLQEDFEALEVRYDQLLLFQNLVLGSLAAGLSVAGIGGLFYFLSDDPDRYSAYAESAP